MKGQEIRLNKFDSFEFEIVAKMNTGNRICHVTGILSNAETKHAMHDVCFIILKKEIRPSFAFFAGQPEAF